MRLRAGVRNRTLSSSSRWLFAFLTMWLLIGAPSHAMGETTVPPRPLGAPVVDRAAILGVSAEAEIEALNRRLTLEANGAELGVLTISTTSGEDPNAYATRAFNTWKLGLGNAEQRCIDHGRRRTIARCS